MIQPNPTIRPEKNWLSNILEISILPSLYAYNMMGNLQCMQYLHSNGLDYYQKAIDILDTQFDGKHIYLIESYEGIGSVYTHQGFFR